MKHWKETLAVWTDTRSIVVVGVVAAMYAALRLPFAAFQIVPGLSEIRPGAVVPPLAGIVFGPAAAWGSAIGNTIGDIYSGMIGPGSVGGFVGNFLLAYVPYRLWAKRLRSHAQGEYGNPVDVTGHLVLVGLVSSLVCAATIAWFVDLLGLVPLAALGFVIFTNNAVVSVILLPILYPMVLPQVRRMRIVQLKSEESTLGGMRHLVGAVLLIGGAVGVILPAVYTDWGMVEGIFKPPEEKPAAEAGTGDKTASAEASPAPQPSEEPPAGEKPKEQLEQPPPPKPPTGAWAYCWWWYILMLIGAILL